MNFTRVCHEVLSLYFKKKADNFITASSSVEKTQRKVLQKIISNLNSSRKWSNLNSNTHYEELISKIPIADYDVYKEDILEQKNNGKDILSADVIRYEPTSGSTNNRKWIPYSKKYMAELNSAAAIWLGDTYQQYPEIKNGKHYWSLSWLPQELRSVTTADDSDLFGFWEGLVLKKTMLMPPNISRATSSEAAWWATLIYLVSAEDLSLVSVWSPTYFLKIIEDIQLHWNDIAKALETNRWVFHEAELKDLLGNPPQRGLSGITVSSSDLFQKLWPQLKLISAWGSSSSKEWFEKLKSNFPQTHFQEKGLWATEGVVSVPFKNKRMLCIENHFYEFIDLENKKIVPSWKLELNKTYQPVIWNSSGLLRYKLQDKVLVSNFFNQVPCIEFIGRINSVDMVGEKLDSQWVLELFQKNMDWQPISLLGCHLPKPHYVLCVLGEKPVDIDEHLMKLHHYQLARELGQLDHARVVYLENISELWSLTNSSQILGQNKVEVLREIQKISDTAGNY